MIPLITPIKRNHIFWEPPNELRVPKDNVAPEHRPLPLLSHKIRDLQDKVQIFLGVRNLKSLITANVHKP